jgi:hypothetical protein
MKIYLSIVFMAFCLNEVKRQINRFEFINTPKHGNWLNMAEIVALHVLNIQCLNRHTATIEYME